MQLCLFQNDQIMLSFFNFLFNLMAKGKDEGLVASNTSYIMLNGPVRVIKKKKQYYQIHL